MEVGGPLRTLCTLCMRSAVPVFMLAGGCLAAHYVLWPLLRAANSSVAPLLPPAVSARLAWFLRHPWHRLVLWFMALLQYIWNCGRSPVAPTPSTILAAAVKRAGGLSDFAFDDGGIGCDNDDGDAEKGGEGEHRSDAARADYAAFLAVLLPALYREWLPYAPTYPLEEKLATRLRIVDFCRRNPDVARDRALSYSGGSGGRAAPKQLVRKPLWIVGLPRTGSTLLHKLLSLDVPRARTLRSWELKAPLPPPCDLPPQAKAARLAEQRAGTAATAAVCPEIADIHFVDADDPDECVNGYYPDPAPVFLWGAVDMPEVYAEYTRSSMARQFADYRLLVQLLCWERAGVAGGVGQGQGGSHTHVVLKSPHHTFHLPSVAAAFPGSTLIWLHRHPREVVGSCCSMNLVFREYTVPWFEDPAALGRRTLARLADAVHAAARGRAHIEAAAKKAQRQKLGKEAEGGAAECYYTRVVDVYYKDLVRNPVGTLRALYAAVGLAWCDELGAAVTAQVGNRGHRTNTKGRHRYRLEDFGLAESDVQEAFADYLAVHGDRL